MAYAGRADVTAQGGGPSTALEWALGAWAFAVELGIVIGAGVVGYRLARPHGAGWAWAAAFAAAAAIGFLWAMWMSPSADARLQVWPRVAVAALLVLVVAYGLWRTSHASVALWFAAIGVLGMAIAQPALEG